MGKLHTVLSQLNQLSKQIQSEIMRFIENSFLRTVAFFMTLQSEEATQEDYDD